MTDTETKAPETETIDLDAARKETQERAAECYREIQAVLEKHRCRIAPFITAPEPVGNDGRRIILGASFGVVPS